MSARLALRIQERMPSLSPSERQLALLLLERQDDLLTYSAAEMARLAGVSKATAARLFRSLGYRDFQDVRIQAREERNRTAPFQSLMADAPQPTARFSIPAYLAAEQANLQRSFQELSGEKLTLGVELLRGAGAIWVIGEGEARPIAATLRSALLLGHANVRLIGPDTALMPAELSMTGPGDALIVLATKPWSKTLRAVLDYARTSRMTVIAITDPDGLATARRYARLAFVAHADGVGASPSLTAMLSLARLLADTLAARPGAMSPSRAELIAEIQEELDDPR